MEIRQVCDVVKRSLKVDVVADIKTIHLQAARQEGMLTAVLHIVGSNEMDMCVIDASNALSDVLHRDL